MSLYAKSMLGIDTGHLILAILILIIHLILYLYSEYFLNRQIPWVKPNAYTSIFHYIGPILFALNYCFDDAGIHLTLFFFIIPVTIFKFSLIWFLAPHYSRAVDYFNIGANFASAYIYVLALLKNYLNSPKGTNVTLAIFTILVLIVALITLCFLREHSLRQAFIKAGSQPK